MLDCIFTGDLVLDEPDPAHWLSGIAPALQRADVVIGHLEVPHTHRGHEMAGDVPAPGADPAHLAALRNAGFHAVTLAGNHIADCSAEGIADTRAELARLNIACCGAGVDLEQATQPALLHAAGKRLALLSYNCVGPEKAWAGTTRAGCAYVRVETADGSPIAPAAPLHVADPQSLAAMCADISAACKTADLVIVALHKGIVHTPIKLAPYERPVAQAAIDAGAHVVIGHHSHIVHGIEFYRGRPIFHGLGNGCVVTRALNPAQDHPARAAWAQKRKQLFGFEPDPDYYLAPFHPQAVNAMLGCLRVFDDGRIETGFVPVFVEAPGRPVLATPEQAKEIAGYMAHITIAACLPPLSMQLQSDRVVVQ